MAPVKLDGPLAQRDNWTATRCSVDKAMRIIGTRSAMLLMREAYYGTTRFDDFASRVGITEAVAATRLKELTEAGLFERSPYKDPGQRTRYEYLLTEMGSDLLPAVLSLMHWGDKYLQGEDGPPIVIVDRKTKKPVAVEIRGESGKTLRAEDLALRINRT